MKTLTQVLLVEGRDDQHVVYSLARHFDMPEVFSVRDEGGIDNLLKALPVRLKGSGVETVGVLIDADVSLAGRWTGLRTILNALGYTDVPVTPCNGGTIVRQEGLPTFGAWMMPDNSLSGMLEDFIAFLVPSNDKLFEFACESVERIPQQERRFTPTHVSKAKIHTWLAWQEDPGTPLGLAITKRYLDPEAETSKVFVSWLKALFERV